VPALASLAAAASLAALPQAGVGVSLGGVQLGMTPAQVRATWGDRFGRCRDCREPTWYYTYRRFAPQGAGVSFARGRVDAVFTVWSPRGWRTTQGLRIGDAAARVGTLYGTLLEAQCGSYSALVARRGPTTTVFYVYADKVWGFGLSRAEVPACR
jgi:hypothetical protein